MANTETLRKVDDEVLSPPPSDTEMAENYEESEEEEDVEKENNKPEIEESKKRRKKSDEKKSTPSNNKKRRESSGSPLTPIERPSRERITVERYSDLSIGKSSTPQSLSIRQGPGTQLKDIPNVAFKLSNRKPDDVLQKLHTILFGKKSKVRLLKRNINQFSGFVWVENEEKQRGKLKDRLEKLVREKLVDFCDILDVPIFKTKMKKEELVEKLVEFMESPHATTDVSLAEKKQLLDAKKKKKKRSSVSSAETKTKKRKLSSEVKNKKESSSKVEEKGDDIDEDLDDAESDEDSEQKEVSDQGDSQPEIEEKEEEQESKEASSKKKAKDGSKVKKPEVVKITPASKKTTPASKKSSNVDDIPSASPKAKISTSKKKKEDDKKKSEKNQDAKNQASNKKESKSVGKPSGKEQGKGKGSVKPKKEPSREEMHAAVSNILKEVDLTTATLSDILRQLGTDFGIDLMHRKAEVKGIITDLVNNMTDEEEGTEDENAAKEGSEDEAGEVNSDS